MSGEYAVSFDANGLILLGFGHAGYSCFVRRVEHNGHLNGYVKIPEGDPLYGKPYDDNLFSRLKVNGGLTFGEKLDGMWILGFDTSHAYDVWWSRESVGLLMSWDMSNRWNDAKVIEETRSLAEQLRKLSDDGKP